MPKDKFMNCKKVELNEDENLLEYMEIDEIPSKFRYIDKCLFYVRGLNILEVEALNRKITDGFFDIKRDLPFLVKLYKNVIKTDTKIDLKEIEIVDFLSLVAVSSTLTMEKFGWNANITCKNIIPNPDIENIKEELNKITEQLSDPETPDDKLEELRNNYQELEQVIPTLEEKVICNTDIKQFIHIGNLQFKRDELNSKTILLDGKEGVKEYNLKPILVKDVLEIIDVEKTGYKENLIKKYDFIDSNIIEKYLSVASMVEGLSLKESFNLLLYTNQETLKEIVDYEKSSKVTIQPLEIKCPKCGHINKVYLDIIDIKVFP